MNSDMAPVIEALKIRKTYRRGAEEIAAVDGIDLVIKRGEYLAVVGPSGSGKTTLLNLLGCLDNPTSGTLKIGGRTVFENGRGLSEGRLTCLRRELFGYVFQNFHLVPTLTVLENVLVPYAFFRKPGTDGRVGELLAGLGLGARLDHRPGELSGGEMQRVAVARALVNAPEVLLADEPTGNLDTRRSDEIATIFRDLNRTRGLTVVLITHNMQLAAAADRVVKLQDGRIIWDGPASSVA